MTSSATYQANDGPCAYVSLFELMMGMSAEEWDALGREHDEDSQDKACPLDRLTRAAGGNGPVAVAKRSDHA